ncbi:Nucleotide-diphospho-sugar transferase [Arabidopsis thaliana x Arabidopsis arenosa]|uniref:Nucleotide-diphospho-sugar transferase n=1 Tax=Arabidopsis thaliana x Arabidopsis arenosa TaxID=1240361 RepID=A0A8T1ZIE8_9BRAS|nr:Nucleotide-diphospho-sugar transferase [Arabidopsis thaliana x Arabidopsis arenosa]
MKVRRKLGGGYGGDVVVSWRTFFWFVILFVFSFVLFSTMFIFKGKLRPVVRSTISFSTAVTARAVLGEAISSSPAVTIREAVKLPEQTLVFLKYPQSLRLFTKNDLICVFSGSSKLRKVYPTAVDRDKFGGQIVRCPETPRGYTISLAVSRWTTDDHLPAGPTHRWDWLVYDAVIDYDNSTVVFVKGLNLRPGRVADVSRYECVYGWDFAKHNRLIRSDVISAAQEIVRCRTPLAVLDGPKAARGPVKVSVRIKGGTGMLPSIAQPVRIINPPRKKPFQMCVCTMTRNAAAVLREWVMYHAGIGVQRWFIYDNNSDDDIISEIENLQRRGYNISRHFWPWIKTQEAGFSNCAIRAKSDCDWIAFIDVDEFFYIPSGESLTSVIRNYTSSDSIGEIRTPCHSFGPSGLRSQPRDGVTAGYTCRVVLPERHKSIIRPEAMNATLINVVHHFHLRDGFTFVDMDKDIMVINHYKYQVWEVFKEKFYRRVATYVADWQNEENVGSRDRAPGLGTRPVEPLDWSERFCEVNDTGLRDQVFEKFKDTKTQRLIWENAEDDNIQRMVSETPSRVTNRSGDGSNGSKEVSIAREKNGENAEIFISPRFKSAAAMAGWDEEDLIIASFVVEDTPERSSSKRRRRSNLLFKSTPPSGSSRRKQRVNQNLVALPVIDLDEVIRHEEEKSAEKKKKMDTETQEEKKKIDKDEKNLSEQNPIPVVLPCIDKLRDELSCAICLEICFEPSTTTCGHSFCKKCLRSAADKCGRKCPKCRQLIGNGRYCTVNTVLWNTIQLLFPKEVEAQRAAAANSKGKETPSPRNPNQKLRSRNRETALFQERLQREDISRLLVSEERSERSERRRRSASMRLDQDRDAALALRLQRQEFASAFGATTAETSSSSVSTLSLARANLRAMASRAVRRQG